MKPFIINAIKHKGMERVWENVHKYILEKHCHHHSSASVKGEQEIRIQ